MLEVELIKLWAEILILEEEESCNKVRQHGSMRSAQLVGKLLQDTKMRVVGSLHETVEKNNHFVELECVLCHDVANFL